MAAWINLCAASHHGEDLIDDAKLTHIIDKSESGTGESRWEPTLLLKGRNLTGADLGDADIRHVDFSGAILNRADLKSAWAEGTHYEKAQLQGAVLKSAQLQGAYLSGADLQGADLSGAELQGANLSQSHLQGAILSGAGLQSAELKSAELQGAFLDYADLRGVDLSGAHILVANLTGANLQGAVLDRAELQGASLDNAELQAASFRNVLVWRADPRNAIWKETLVADPTTAEKAYCGLMEGLGIAIDRPICRRGYQKRCEDAPPEREVECDWTADDFEKLKQADRRTFSLPAGPLVRIPHRSTYRQDARRKRDCNLLGRP